MKLQNLIHILMGIVCIALLPKAPAAPLQRHQIQEL
jgi:hypothetical protein